MIADATEQAARVFAAALDATNSTATAIADHIGVGRTIVDQWRRTDGTKSVRLEHVLAMPLAIRKHIAQAIVGDAYDIVARPVANSEQDVLRLVCAAQRESSDVVCAALGAVADGTITASEGVKLEQVGLAAIRALTTIAELGRRAQRERVIGVSRIA